MQRSSIAVVLAALGQISCSGGRSQPGAPTMTPPQFAIVGATTLSELRDSVQLSLQSGTQDLTNLAAWQTSNAGVATVSSGLVRATGPGMVSISSTYQGQTVSASLTVVQDDDCFSYDPTHVGTMPNTHDAPPSVTITVPFQGQLEGVAAADNQTDAKNLVALLQRYNQHCYIGRNNSRSNHVQYVVTYFKGASGQQTTIAPEDCVSYNAGALQVVNQGGSGWALISGGTQLALLDTQLGAALVGEIAAQSSNECFIGRGNTRSNPYQYITEYWK